MMNIQQRVLVASMLCVFAGCDDPTYQSERGQLGLELDDLVGGPLEKGTSELDAVVGTRVCPRFVGWYEHDGDDVRYHVRDDDEEDDGWLRSCFASSASGASRIEDDCVVLEAPGSSALELTPRACAVQDDADIEFTADRLAIDGWALADVVLGYDDLRRLFYGSLLPGPADAFPPPDQRAPSEPLRAIAGAEILLLPQTFAADDPDHAIGYTDGVPRVVGDDVRPELQQEIALGVITLELDEQVAVALQLPAGELIGPELLAVDAATASSMELLVGYHSCDGCELGWGEVAIAQAIVRDGEGRRLWGADVDFEIGGLTADYAPFHDAVQFEGCSEAEAGTTRHETITARYLELTAIAQVEYACAEAAAEPDDGPEVVHDDAGADDPFDDLLGCGCTSDPHPRGVLVLLGLALLGRRRARHSTISPRTGTHSHGPANAKRRRQVTVTAPSDVPHS
jgi:MYXO-CTERM domain-containing protein